MKMKKLNKIENLCSIFLYCIYWYYFTRLLCNE